MKKGHLGISLFFILSLILSVNSQLSPDSSPMHALRVSLGNPSSLNWSDPDPCKWSYITCGNNNRVTRIQIRSLNLKGKLPPELRNLTSLIVLEVANNQLTGPIPSLAGLSSLQQVLFNNNSFSYIPSGLFTGLTSLQSISLDYNPFSSWEIPESLKDATALKNFSANGANVSGTIPDFVGGDTFPGLTNLHLAMNNLQGPIPGSFSNSSIQTLWLNGQTSSYKLNGSITVLQTMKFLTQLWLHKNLFSGPLPDFSGLMNLVDLSLRENQFTGIVPLSLVNLPKLTTVNLTHNFLQGPTPKFNNSNVHVDMEKGTNSFCLDDPDLECDSEVNILLSIAESVGYPLILANDWKGNDPCPNWEGITCDNDNNITGVDFKNFELSGTISTNFSMLTFLERLILSNNSLTGTIPNELTTLQNLEVLDVSNNQLHGKMPTFRNNVTVYTDGNPGIEKDNNTIPSPPGLPPSKNGNRGKSLSTGRGKNLNLRIVVGSAIGAVCGIFIVILGVCMYIRKRKSYGSISSQSTGEIHASDDGDANEVKTTASKWSVSTGSEFGYMFNSIQVLRNATNDFSEENILGRGGFGTVFKGKLQDGTEIAVKRTGSGVVSEKALAEFKSEIEVLTKVRHRHLLALLGYCLDGDERLLVYEYMPQGTLSRHLFNWKEEGLKPLEWNRRLTIALDVARGVEYLHGLAHQSFIHRDLKPSNILLGDDMRAKVADFGLVRLVPEYGKNSIETRVAGTFGYLAPECIVTGRVTTKVDVFSFGVILMELITGRKAIDATCPEDMAHLLTWFRSMQIKEDTFRKAIDETIELDEETFANIRKVSELADHCCASEPHQRPDMGHVVYVLSSLVDFWRPAEPVSDDRRGFFDFDITCTSSEMTNYFISSSDSRPLVTMEELHYTEP